MIGNVWEWTADPYRAHADHAADGPAAGGYYGPGEPGIARQVMKGGSHLCAPNYCRRYRPAARMALAIDTSTSHLGFRCIRRDIA